MGISGLLPALKSITESKSLEDYRGQTLAIDGYCWLHRAIYSCSQEICLGEETDKYVNYFIERVDMLLHNGIVPYVVFDGGPLPMKKGTEVERRAARQKNRELGIQFYKQRNYTEARKCFSRAADVSPFMAHRIIQRLKAKNVRYVVAPYEADAQLAYLTKNGLADGVITEDSDCLPFGCGTVLFKLDKDGVGLAQEIKESNLKKNKGLLFHMFTHEMFLEMCIFSGCDYLPSLPGFGLKKAYTALKQHGSFAKVIRALRLEGKVRIPPTYETNFEKAVLTFRHQRVFDPRSQQLVPLTPISDSDMANDAAMEYLGPMLANDVAIAIAEGDMDPITMERFPPTAAPSSRSSNYNISGYSNGSRVGANAFPVRPSSFLANRQGYQQQSQPKKPSPMFAAAPQSIRKLPSSFAQRAEPPTPLFNAVSSKPSSAAVPSSSSSSSLPSRSAESSPPVVSRFFAGQPKRASPLGETEKTMDAMPASSSSSSFESQEPLDVDVARSISFSPVEEKKHAHAHTATVAENKENRTPHADGSLGASPSPPSVQENAFSRMMRAGSLLQKQSLKRKAAANATGSRFGKQKSGGIYGHHHHHHQHRSAEQRLLQYAHTASSSSNIIIITSQEDPVVAKDYVSSSLAQRGSSSHFASEEEVKVAEPEAEQDTTGEESERQSNDSSSNDDAVVARGACLVAVKQSTSVTKVTFEYAAEDNQPSHFERRVSSKSSTSVLASLDRFRFKK